MAHGEEALLQRSYASPLPPKQSSTSAAAYRGGDLHRRSLVFVDAGAESSLLNTHHSSLQMPAPIRSQNQLNVRQHREAYEQHIISQQVNLDLHAGYFSRAEHADGKITDGRGEESLHGDLDQYKNRKFLSQRAKGKKLAQKAANFYGSSQPSSTHGSRPHKAPATDFLVTNSSYLQSRFNIAKHNSQVIQQLNLSTTDQDEFNKLVRVRARKLNQAFKESKQQTHLRQMRKGAQKVD